MAVPADRRPLARVLLCAFTAATLTASVVSLAPHWFFGASAGTGPLREPSAPVPLVLLGIALLASAIFAALCVGSHRISRFGVAAAGLLVLALPAAAFVGYGLWEYHEEPEFCADTCHVMEPAFEQYGSPGANLVMKAHHDNSTALCLDCHQGPGAEGQVDLLLTSAKHVWKAWVTKDYDPDDLGGPDWTAVVPDENCQQCHGDGLAAALPQKHDRYSEDCAMCHSPHQSDHVGYFFPDKILETEDCTTCHDDLPRDMLDVMGGHAQVGDDGCRECHTAHGLRSDSNVKTCGEEGCHIPQAEDLLSLGHAAYGDDACDACHEDPHDVGPPPIDMLARNCTDCHDMTRRDPDHLQLAVRDAEGTEGTEGVAHEVIDCVSCHKEHDLDVPGALVGCQDGSCHGDPVKAGPERDMVHRAFTAEACGDCHGAAHDLVAPTVDAVAGSCTDCHGAPAQRVQQTRHGGTDCADCHTAHAGSAQPTLSCKDSGCHAAQVTPGADSSHAGTDADCADCHSGGHDVRAPRIRDLVGACEDCHYRPADHADIPCESCHIDHSVDAPKEIRTCTDSLCHGDARGALALDAPHPAVGAGGSGVCADCHETHFPSVSPTIRDQVGCEGCHKVSVADSHGDPSAHTGLAAQGCDSCHDPHAEDPFQNTCVDCHSSDGQAPAHGGRITADMTPTECAECHGTAHDTAGTACEDCHSRHGLPAGDLHADTIDMSTAACTECHSSSQPGQKTADEHWGHGKQQCTTCHREGNPRGAPAPDFEDEARSQVSWMRQHGGGYGVWNQAGRGSHDPGSDCADCHDFDDPAVPHYPDAGTCDSSCHSWLQDEVEQAGFVTNDEKDTTYRGTLDPEALLEGTGTAHGGFYADYGCTGYCHNEAPKSGVPSDRHGLVNSCTDCHSYAFTEPELNLHSTHIPFVSAEQGASDTESGYGSACAYCHSAGDPDNVDGDASFGAGGGCYNCHLSGHDPTTVYWEMGDEAAAAQETIDGAVGGGVGLPHPVDVTVTGRPCVECHGGFEYPSELAPVLDLRPHPMTQMSCTSCHAEGGNAPVPKTEDDPSSQRAWARQIVGTVPSHGAANDYVWMTSGRGEHPGGGDCGSCHNGYSSTRPYDDPSLNQDGACDTSCHSWLEKEVTQPGFTNSDGDTPTFKGTLDPLTLLTDPRYTTTVEDGEAVLDSHAQIYEESGCTGFCHGGKDGTAAPHGTVDQCFDCHGSGDGDYAKGVHDTHRSSGTGKDGRPPYTKDPAYADADPDSPYVGDDCSYCHGKAESPGGCYNCHVSGHYPEAIYWSRGTTEPSAQGGGEAGGTGDGEAANGGSAWYETTGALDPARSGLPGHPVFVVDYLAIYQQPFTSCEDCHSRMRD